MFFLQNPKIQQLLIQEKIFTKEYIEQFLIEYSFHLIDLVVDEIQIYIEEKKLDNVEKYLRSIADSIKKKPHSTIDDQVKFYTEIFNILKDYPDLQKRVDDEMLKLEDEMNAILLEGQSDDFLLKFLDIVESDLKEIKKEQEAAKRLMASPDYDKV